MRGGKRPNSGRKKGSIPWNKGVPMSQESKAKLSASKKGTPAWNKGLPAPWLKGNTHAKGKVGFWKGKKLPKEAVEKMRLAKKGKISPKKGIPMPEVQKVKISVSLTGREASDSHRESNRKGQYKRYLKVNPNYKVIGRNKRIAENGGFHSEDQWQKLKEKYNFTCANPNCKKSEPEIKLTRDHIIALAMGGSHGIENIQPLCSTCNRKKHTNTIRY